MLFYAHQWQSPCVCEQGVPQENTADASVGDITGGGVNGSEMNEVLGSDEWGVDMNNYLCEEWMSDYRWRICI